MKKIMVPLVSLLFLFAPALVFAETIILKSGKIVEGKIIEKTDSYIKVGFMGITLTFFLDEVKSINNGISSTANEDKVELRLRVKEGDRYQLNVGTVLRVFQGNEEQKQYIQDTYNIGYKLEVVNVDTEGNISFRYTCNSVLFKRIGPMGTVEYDSSNLDAPIPDPVKHLAILCGESIVVKITPEGVIMGIDGLDSLVSSVIKKLGITDSTGKDKVEEKIRENCRLAFKESLEERMEYPKNPVAIGDSWTKEVVVSQGFPVIMENTKTLIDRSNGLAVIKVDSKIKPYVETTSGKLSSTNYDLQGIREGTQNVEESTGLVINSRINRKVSGQVKNGGASWPITIESVHTMETKKL